MSREQEWEYDMRQLEGEVAEELERDGFPRPRNEGRSTIVQTGFHTFIAGPNELAVTWRAASSHIVLPIDEREKRFAIQEADCNVPRARLGLLCHSGDAIRSPAS